MIQKYKSLNINSLKTRLCFTGKSYVIIYDNQKTILILITNRNEGNLLERIQTMKL